MLGDSSVVAFPLLVSLVLLGGVLVCLPPSLYTRVIGEQAIQVRYVVQVPSFRFLCFEGGGAWPSCTLYFCLYLLGTLYLMPFIFF